MKVAGLVEEVASQQAKRARLTKRYEEAIFKYKSNKDANGTWFIPTRISIMCIWSVPWAMVIAYHIELEINPFQDVFTIPKSSKSNCNSKGDFHLV